ncbi:MAG: YMGG-like glycine zipper-containing protein [Candidatus Binatia bacterium]
MTKGLKKQVTVSVLSASLMGLGTAGCGTITGAALGGATGAGIGASTHHSVERSAIIGAGVGGALGAAYDIYDYRRDRDRDYYD